MLIQVFFPERTAYQIMPPPPPPSPPFGHCATSLIH